MGSCKRHVHGSYVGVMLTDLSVSLGWQASFGGLVPWDCGSLGISALGVQKWLFDGEAQELMGFEGFAEPSKPELFLCSEPGLLTKGR